VKCLDVASAAGNVAAEIEANANLGGEGRATESPHRIAASRLGFRVQGSWVQGSGFRVQGSGFRVQGSEFRVRVLGLRVKG